MSDMTKFPAHAALAAQVKRHPSGYNATLYDTVGMGDIKDCESVTYDDLLAEFTALKQAADGLRDSLQLAIPCIELQCRDDGLFTKQCRQALSHFEQLTREKE